MIPAQSRAARLKDLGFRLAMLACLAIGLVTLAVLLVDVTVDGIGELSWSFLSEFASFDPSRAGIAAALSGTLWVMAVCTAFVVPVGVATAVYLEEYADGERWHNRVLEANIQNLAAVPSIVYGILGLAFLVRGPLSLGRVVLAGGLTMGLLVLPVVIIAGREAVRAVPSSIREGSLALGATQWQTIWRQILPAAVPGIATGAILALARAIGETAPLIMVGAATFVGFHASGLFSHFTVMPLQIFEWISRPQPEFQLRAAAAIIVLMVVLLGMNAVAIWMRNKFERKW